MSEGKLQIDKCGALSEIKLRTFSICLPIFVDISTCNFIRQKCCCLLDLVLQQHAPICFNFNAKLYSIACVRVSCLPIRFITPFHLISIKCNAFELTEHFVVHPWMNVLSQNQLHGQIDMRHVKSKQQSHIHINSEKQRGRERWRGRKYLQNIGRKKCVCAETQLPSLLVKEKV